LPLELAQSVLDGVNQERAPVASMHPNTSRDEWDFSRTAVRSSDPIQILWLVRAIDDQIQAVSV
jgi:hypothetical protein